MIPAIASARRIRYKAPTAASWTWNTSTTNWTRDGAAIAYPSGTDVYQAELNTAGTQTITPGVASIPVNLLYLSATGTKTISASGTNKLTFTGTYPSIYTISGATASITAPISSIPQWVKFGSGKVTLAGANTFTGGILLREGTISINNVAAFGSGGLTIGSAGSNDSPTIDLVSSAVPYSLSTNFSVTVNTDFSFTSSAGGDMRFSATSPWSIVGDRTITISTGRIDILGAVTGNSIIKLGAGQLCLFNSSPSWTNGVYFYEGILNLSSANCIPSSGFVQIGGDGSGASKTLTNSGGSPITMGCDVSLVESFTWSATYGLTFSQPATVNSFTPGTPVTITNGTNFSFGGLTCSADGVGGATGSLTKIGTGALSISGPITLNAGTNTSTITIGAGQVNFGGKIDANVALTAAGTILNNSISPAANLSITNNVTITTTSATISGSASGNTVSFDGPAFTASTNTLSLTVSGSNLTVNCPATLNVQVTKLGGTNITFANTVSGAGRLVTNVGVVNISTASFGNLLTLGGGTFSNTQSAAQNLSVSSAVTLSAATTITGTTTSHTVGFGSTLTLAASATITCSTPVTITGNVSGAFVLTKAGTQSLRLNGVGSMSGTSVSAGTLLIGNTSALGSTGSLTISSGATVDCANAGLANGDTIFSGTLAQTGTITISASGNNMQKLSVTGNVTMSTGARLLVSASSVNTGKSWNVITWNGTGTTVTNLLFASTGTTTMTVGSTTLTLNYDTVGKRIYITT